MAEHPEGAGSMIGDLVEKVTEKIHHLDDVTSSSSDSDEDKPKPSVSDAINRLFGRKQPVHKVLGGGKLADIFLWRNKKTSAGILCGVTLIWLLFEWLGYYLLTLACHLLILGLVIIFLWSNGSSFIHKSPPQIPEVKIPDYVVVNIARSLTFEINQGFVQLREVASVQDLKKFLGVIAGLWVLSILGSCCNFLTLFYIAFVLLHTVPVLYDKYEDQVDAFAEKVIIEAKKQYAVFDAKVLSKIPKGALKEKKF